jgi:beta-1,4-mannosyl-glycoprotein beta-1,4-N-acetylglucosaminyltransferase
MIYDCFTYFNEDLVLDIRFNTLDEFVDKFVVVEATKDHSGRPKGLNFNINNFSRFKKKINYVVVDDIPNEANSFYNGKVKYHENFVRENYQRNQIMKGIQEADDDDLIIISDADEIPDLRKLKNFNLNKCTIFYQKSYQYKLNLLAINDWPGSRIIKKKFLISPQELRYKIVKRIKFWQFHRHFTNPNFIINGGWHFSYLGSPEKIKLKIESFAHGEFNKENITDLNTIKNNINNKKDIFNKNTFLQKVEIDNSFPEYILRNKPKFVEYII